MKAPMLISMSHLDGTRFRVVLRLSIPGLPSWIVTGVLDKRAGTFRPEGALVRLGGAATGEAASDLYWEEGEEPLVLAQIDAWARRFVAPAVRVPLAGRAA
jgi:hypothetical protein